MAEVITMIDYSHSAVLSNHIECLRNDRLHPSCSWEKMKRRYLFHVREASGPFSSRVKLSYMKESSFSILGYRTR